MKQPLFDVMPRRFKALAGYSSLGAAIYPERPLTARQALRAFRAAPLTERQVFALRQRFGLNGRATLTLAALSRLLPPIYGGRPHVCPQRAGQIEQNALRKLRLEHWGLNYDRDRTRDAVRDAHLHRGPGRPAQDPGAAPSQAGEVALSVEPPDTELRPPA